MTVKHIAFAKIPKEKMDGFTRQYVHGEKATFARFEFKQGAVVPEHHHINEQITYILSGAAKVTVQGKEHRLGAGDVLIIPPHAIHKLEALEDTVDVEVFSPPREDWVKRS